MKLYLQVFFVEDDEGNITSLGGADYIPVGYKIHLDVTAKDASGQVTNGDSNVGWTFANAKLGGKGVDFLLRIVALQPFQRRLVVLAPGVVFAQASLGGVQSNQIRLLLGNPPP